MYLSIKNRKLLISFFSLILMTLLSCTKGKTDAEAAEGFIGTWESPYGQITFHSDKTMSFEIDDAYAHSDTIQAIKNFIVPFQKHVKWELKQDSLQIDVAGLAMLKLKAQLISEDSLYIEGGILKSAFNDTPIPNHFGLSKRILP